MTQQTILNQLTAADANPTFEQLTDEKVLAALCEERDSVEREKLKAMLLSKAPYKTKTSLDKIYKLAIRQDTLRRLPTETHTTAFSDLPAGAVNLNCGVFEASDKGVTCIDEYGQTMTVSGIPITIKRLLIDVETGAQSVELLYKQSGAWTSRTVRRSAIGTLNSIHVLSDFGVDVSQTNARYLIAYLRELLISNQPFPTSPMCSRCGWMRLDGRDVFMPFVQDVVFGGAQDYGDIYNALQPRGDYEAWKAFIRPFYEGNNAIVRGMLAASFAAPVLGLQKDLSFVVHLWGGTGNHKSVALMVAASVWGNPDLSNGGYIHTFNNTQVG